VCFQPASIDAYPESSTVGVGVHTVEVEPVPVAPWIATPQQRARSSPDRSVKAHVWNSPAATSIHPASPTRCGVTWSSCPPMTTPSSPNSPRPKHHSVPPARIPHVWATPALTSIQSASTPTCCGVVAQEKSVVPMLQVAGPVFGRPSWASAFSPQHHRVPSSRMALLAARTASLAGGVQVVARSVETALHKLHELKFDLSRVVGGYGVAPLPPIAGDDLAAIGRTNDAVLYGGEVTLFCLGDDASLKAAGEQLPSSASRDHGRPFAEIFKRYNHDFYRIDPLLFSPAAVCLQNLETGHSFRFGAVETDVMMLSFFG